MPIGTETFSVDGTGWRTYTPSISATITAPSLGTGGLAKGLYKVIGKSLYYKCVFVSTGASSSVGSGAYLFKIIPNGYTINTDMTGIETPTLSTNIVPTAYAVGEGGCIGSTTASSAAEVIVASTTQVALLTRNGSGVAS